MLWVPQVQVTTDTLSKVDKLEILILWFHILSFSKNIVGWVAKWMFQELCFAIKREKSFIRLAIITNNCCLTHLIIRCLIVLLWKPNGSKKAANFSIPPLSFFDYFLLSFSFLVCPNQSLKALLYSHKPKWHTIPKLQNYDHKEIQQPFWFFHVQQVVCLFSIREAQVAEIWKKEWRASWALHVLLQCKGRGAIWCMPF